MLGFLETKLCPGHRATDQWTRGPDGGERAAGIWPLRRLLESILPAQTPQPCCVDAAFVMQMNAGLCNELQLCHRGLGPLALSL